MLNSVKKNGHTKGVAYIMTDGTKIIYPLEYLSLERVWDTTDSLKNKPFEIFSISPIFVLMDSSRQLALIIR